MASVEKKFKKEKEIVAEFDCHSKGRLAIVASVPGSGSHTVTDSATEQESDSDTVPLTEIKCH